MTSFLKKVPLRRVAMQAASTMMVQHQKQQQPSFSSSPSSSLSFTVSPYTSFRPTKSLVTSAPVLSSFKMAPPSLAALRSSFRPVVNLGVYKLVGTFLPTATTNGLVSLQNADVSFAGIHVDNTPFLALPGSAAASQLVVYNGPSYEEQHQVTMKKVLVQFTAFVTQRAQDKAIHHQRLALAIAEFCRKWIQKFVRMTNKDRTAIAEYTTTAYKFLNGALRNSEKKPIKEWWQKRIAAIVKAMTKRSLPTFEGTVYRGSNLTPEMEASIETGATFSDKGFLSTTKDKDQAFAKSCLFVIESKTGKDITERSTIQEEAEILFPPRTTFRIESVVRGSKGEISVVHMTELA